MIESSSLISPGRVVGGGVVVPVGVVVEGGAVVMFVPAVVTVKEKRTELEMFSLSKWLWVPLAPFISEPKYSS